MLPSRRLRLGTSPACTGSLPVVKTIGIVVVAFFAAILAGVLATITRPLGGEPNRLPSLPAGHSDLLPSPHKAPPQIRGDSLPHRMRAVVQCSKRSAQNVAKGQQPTRRSLAAVTGLNSISDALAVPVAAVNGAIGRHWTSALLLTCTLEVSCACTGAPEPEAQVRS
jgi:hypothetical protein